VDAARILTDARRRAGISQRELARRAGTSQAAVARIELARQSPSIETLRRLVAACGIDLELELPAEGAAPPRALDGRLLRFALGDAAFAVPLAATREVLEVTPGRRLPGQPEGVGVTFVRGRLVTTIDTATRLGIPEALQPRTMIVIATRSGEFAVTVSQVHGIVDVPPERLAPPPPTAAAGPFVAAVAEIGGELVVVLDPQELCANLVT
jgi:chemotaxis signal transduction protein/DNA-binding XRE family transcriptional regulator